VDLEVLVVLEASLEVSLEDLAEDSEIMMVRKKSKKKEKRRKSHKRFKRKKCLMSTSTDRTATIDVHSIIEL
jgi:hypothetical protein